MPSAEASQSMTLADISLGQRLWWSDPYGRASGYGTVLRIEPGDPHSIRHHYPLVVLAMQSGTEEVASLDELDSVGPEIRKGTTNP